MLLQLVLLVTTSENGMEPPARVQLRFSPRHSNERQMTNRAPVSSLLVVTGRVDIEEITQGATDAIGTIVVSATRVVVSGVSRWVMRLKIVGAHDLRIRINNNNHLLHETNSSNNSEATGDAINVVLKATSSETAPS